MSAWVVAVTHLSFPKENGSLKQLPWKTRGLENVNSLESRP